PRTPLARALNAVQRRLPLDRNLAVYRAHPGRGVGGDLVAVQAKVRELAPRVRSVFLVAADAVDRVPVGVEHAVLGSPRAGRLLARAAYVVDDGALTDTLVKRPGSVHLRIAPGTPLKATGLDRSGYPVAAAGADGFAGANALLGHADRWDFVLSSNRHTTETWERAFPGGYAPLEYGSPRNDVLCAATADDVARARRALGIPEGVQAVLYAPTHRDHAPGRGARLDLEAFGEAVGEKFVVLLRAPHRSAAVVVPRGSGGRIIDVTAHPCVEEVCLAADALITDYASLMFDYAHLDRPMVILADDWEVFRETRGVCLDLPAAPPGHVARTERELADLFRDGSYADGEAGALRAAFRERFCQFDDGRAAERVVRRVFLGERPETLPPVVPLAERSPAPASAPTLTPSPTPTAATLVRS
ncbi:CDP-glycerol glycerophosphotransferase family protein, partial [Streptomyces caniscabiei]